ncbi:hypothetical protein HK098_005136, partial [Nowakowskiella sp. JEL0407]
MEIFDSLNSILNFVLKKLGVLPIPTPSSDNDIPIVRVQLTHLSLETLLLICSFIDPASKITLSNTCTSVRRALIKSCFSSLTLSVNTKSLSFMNAYISNPQNAKLIRYCPQTVHIISDYSPTRLRSYRNLILFFHQARFANLQVLRFENFPTDLLDVLGKYLLQIKTLRRLEFGRLHFFRKFLLYNTFYRGLESLKLLEKFELGVVAKGLEKILLKAHFFRFLEKYPNSLRKLDKITSLTLSFVTLDCAKTLAAALAKLPQIKSLDLAFHGAQSECDDAVFAISEFGAFKLLRNVCIRLPSGIVLHDAVLTAICKLSSTSQIDNKTLHIETNEFFEGDMCYDAFELIRTLNLSALMFHPKIRFRSIRAFEKFFRSLCECSTLNTFSTIEFNPFIRLDPFLLFVERCGSLTNLGLNFVNLEESNIKSLSKMFTKNRTLKRLSIWIHDDTRLTDFIYNIPRHPNLEYLEIFSVGSKESRNPEKLKVSILGLLLTLSESESKIVKVGLKLKTSELEMSFIENVLKQNEVRFESKGTDLRIFRESKIDLKVIGLTTNT